jgi:CheY-like chemotaxis protein
MDGFELTQALRERSDARNLPIFMLTSSASPGDNARCTELKVAARLLKPVKQSLLLDNIVRVLAGANRVDAPAPSATTEAAADESKRPLRVLLAEDQEVNRKFAVRLLGNAGHEVVVAVNGREAVEKWKTERVDLILMDLQMPELDGLDATREIRATEATAGGHIPIIALTANAMQGDREMCHAAGMDGYVPKPVKKEALFNEMARIMKEFGHG